MASSKSDWLSFCSIMSSSKAKSVRWLFSRRSADARAHLVVIRAALGHLCDRERRILLKNVSRGDAATHESSLYELLTFELLYRLRLQPEFQPSVSGLTPDLRFVASGHQFIGDVYVIHSPLSSWRVVPLLEQIAGLPSRLAEIIGRIGGEAYESRDSGHRAQKIAGVVLKKETRYRRLGIPLVVFVVIGDRFGLSLRNAMQALLGRFHDWGQFELRNVLDPSLAPPRAFDPLFIPNPDGSPASAALSAVVACDWFDSSVDTCPGYRLAAWVLRHWKPGTNIPAGAFGGFPEVKWLQGGPQLWSWRFEPNEPVVAGFHLSAGVRFGVHSADHPW